MSVPADDLTGRARIRDAALEEFAEHGVRGATIRAVAARAGVSPTLVQHHFGTKDGLRAACDDHVLAQLRRQVSEGLDDGGLGEPDFLAATYASAPPLLRYLARALVDGSPTAAGMFDQLVVLTETHLAGRPDVRGQAVVLVAMRLGVVVLHEHVSRGLGADLFSAESLPRVSRAGLELLSPTLLPDGVAEKVRTGLDSYEQGSA